MANTTIKTRILLRNDTLENWESNASSGSPLILAKGEVAIATGLDGNLAEVRVGTGSSSWTNALKIAVDASQISGIQNTIRGIAKDYRLEAGTGVDANKWFLQEKPMSAEATAWTTVSTLDLNILTGYALSTDVTTLVESALTAAEGYATSAITTANNYTDTQINALSGTADEKFLLKTTFSTISTDIGLDRASSTDKVVVQSDIADLAGAMHFIGTVTLNEGETVAEAAARIYPDHTVAAGDVVVVTSTSKEYVYAGGQWVELGDEDLYAKKSEVYTRAEICAIASNVFTSSTTSANSYTDAEIAKLNISSYALSTDVNTRITEAKSYTDTAIQGLDVSDTENGNANAGFVTKVTEIDGKVSVVKKEIQLSDITDVNDISVKINLSSYALSADVTQAITDAKQEVVGQSTDTSAANTVYGAKAYAKDYADAKVDELSSGFLILDCGGAALRTDEPTAAQLGA